MKTASELFAAVLCIGLVAGVPASAQAPQPFITEAFVDAETATLTFNGIGFSAGHPTVYLGNNELPVRWAHENSTATWLPELWPGTYRLIASWPDGSQADFFLTVGAIGPAGPKGDRGPEGPRGMAGFASAGDASSSVAADETTTTTTTTTLPTLDSESTRYGTDALATRTTGLRNAAFGVEALKNATTGSFNVAFGYRALAGFSQMTGTHNTAFGNNALRVVSTGSYNVAIGPGALGELSTGTTNIAIGNAAGGGITGSDHNVAIGPGSLRGSGVESNNTVVGWRALSVIGPLPVGGNNTAIGTEALRGRVSIGSGNIAVGYRAGYGNPGGRNNIYIGNAGNSTTDVSGIIRIGTPSTHTETNLAGTVNASVDVKVGSVSLLDLAERVKRLEEPETPPSDPAANPQQ